MWFALRNTKGVREKLMATVALPNCNDTKERLSLAFLRAVAARCRCIVAPEEGGDYGSVDAWVTSSKQPRRLLWVQLKCTSGELDVVNGEVCYDLPLNNYNDLRATDAPTIQLLLVHQLPPDETKWLNTTSSGMSFRRVTWWADLYGLPESTNTSTVRIKIPKKRIFTPDSLMRLMEFSATLRPGATRKPAHEY